LLIDQRIGRTNPHRGKFETFWTIISVFRGAFSRSLLTRAIFHTGNAIAMERKGVDKITRARKMPERRLPREK